MKATNVQCATLIIVVTIISGSISALREIRIDVNVCFPQLEKIMKKAEGE